MSKFSKQLVTSLQNSYMELAGPSFTKIFLDNSDALDSLIVQSGSKPPTKVKEEPKGTLSAHFILESIVEFLANIWPQSLAA